MKKLFLLAGATLVFTTFAPMASNAQSVGIETPGVEIHNGDRYREHRAYDEPRFHERRVYRDRDVGLRRGCKTVTIHRDDGSMKRITRCD